MSLVGILPHNIKLGPGLNIGSWWWWRRLDDHVFSWHARPELLVILILYRHSLYRLYWHSFQRNKESLISPSLNPNSLLTWYNFSLSFEVKFLQPPGSCSWKFSFRPFYSFNTVQHARGGMVRYERALLALHKMFRFLVIFETSGSF